ncbi:PGAP1-like protein-domain-containing protein, partial [Russula aff. rugulosa BPL654]
MLSALVAFFSISLVGLLYRATSDSATSLSPQGCRMSYMSPSYFIQSREPRGAPVLFIPGNAGSAHQIRSIASSATRQYYASPYIPSPEFTSHGIKPLDFFAVEYNEDLSAFHGPTLDVEREYTHHRHRSFHGGVVATSLLPSPNISAVITMSTPHKIPPARFDRRIAAIYEHNKATLTTADTPILSLCGGATDLMVPSESCILPDVTNGNVYRRTIFSSALEGCWTGVGHQVIVWCHQVRWRVARAALELGAASVLERALILDRWLRDGRSLSSTPGHPARLDLSQENYAVRPSGPVVLRNLRKSRAVYLSPVPEANHPIRFVAYVYEGSVLSMAPHHPSSLSVTFYLCSSTTNAPHDPSSRPACEEWHPTSLKLIPNASPERLFPVPHEGVDESEGVVVFEASLPERDDKHRWVAVAYTTNEERGWIVSDFVQDERILSEFTAHDLLYKDAIISLNPKDVLSRVHLPSLLSNVLLVYRVTAIHVEGQCSGATSPSPLLEHVSFSEAHFHPLTQSRPLLLHSHIGSPFTSSAYEHGVNLTLYTSPDCQVASLRLHIDWWGTLGRAGARYWTAVPGWAVGIVMWVMFTAMGINERGAPVPSVSETLFLFVRGSSVVSLLPLPRDYVLGNSGEVFFALLTPLILLLVTGLVIVSWWVICIVMFPIRVLACNLARKKTKNYSGVNKNTIISMLLILLLVAVILPWQVAFLGCWVIHLVTCATTYHSRRPRHEADHVLLLLTWLLPLAAPVLAVWVRTLATGMGDHNFLSVAPYLILVEYASSTRDSLLPRNKLEFISARWCLMPPAIGCFLRGARHTYEVFDWVWVAVSVLVVLRVGP